MDKVRIGQRVRYINPKNLGGRVTDIYKDGTIRFESARGGGYTCYPSQLEPGEPVFYTGPTLEAPNG